ncbi:MAG: IclR family transcriptional regulator [Alphaproteobacteria bacterium]|nr:MAG: IclR family transcriptional regulator [Alphaproteobacteria bacterium]
MQNSERNPLAKAFALLRWVVDANVSSIGVREAAKALSMTPSSAHRVIMALVEEGLLEQQPDSSRYVLGLEMVRLAHTVTDRWSVRTIAQEPLRQLVAASEEAAFLNLYDRARGEIIGVECVESNQVLRYVVELHKWKPVYVGAAGWAVMAHLDDAERQAIVKRTALEPVTALSITDPLDLEEQLDQVRVRGYAITHGQRIPGAVGLAVPLFGPSGRVFGSIGLSMPEQRFSVGKELRLSTLLKQCAAQVMQFTGGHGHDSTRLSTRETAKPGPVSNQLRLEDSGH